MGDLSKFIPELFYDLLGRVVPGAIAIWIWLYALGIDLTTVLRILFGTAKVLSDSAFVVTTTLMLIAYLIGHLISPISSFMHLQVLARLFPSYFKVLQNAALSSHNPYPSNIRLFFNDEVSRMFREKDRNARSSEYRRITYLWYDSIRLFNPIAGTRLAKMRAEYRMLEGIYVVFTLALILHIMLSWPTRHTISWGFIIGSTLAIIIAGWSAARLFRTFQWAVINHYYHVRSVDSSASGAKSASSEALTADSQQKIKMGNKYGETP
jgi:hypothetical protein